MFFEPYMPELQCSPDTVRTSGERRGYRTADVRHGPRGRLSRQIRRSAREQLAPAAMRHGGLIAAVAVVGVAVGFYRAVAASRKRS